MHSLELLPLIKATWETLYMVFLSSLISLIVGLGVGILLFLTKEKDLFENKWLNQALGLLVNATRSIPFIILMIMVLPITRMVVGTTIGTNAAIVPLTLAAIPFFARICESALTAIPHGMIETAHALGVTKRQLITKILIPESAPALIRGITLTVIGLIGYSAMAGAIGGGGLGELAINYGYQRFDFIITLETVIVLIFIVQGVQWGGDALAEKRQFKPIIMLSVALTFIFLGSQFYPVLTSNEATIKVGVPTGWSEDVMKVAEKVALEKYHLHIKTIPFSDYILPNSALADGSIDANIFQHVPYLDAQIKANHFELVPIAKTFIYPMGFYSRSITTLSSLKDGSLVAIPNDPSNQARALLLLQKAGLISLKSKVLALSNLRDIVQNPKHLRFKLLDAAQLPRVLKDADLVAITNDFVSAAGLKMNEALLKESSDSLYANVIVVKKNEKDNPVFQELVAIMHSKPVINETEKIFPDGAAIPAWK